MKQEMLQGLIIGSCLVMSLAGCASVPMGDAKRDLELKEFRVPPEMAGLYIYRNQFLAGAWVTDVELDGQQIGQTGPKTYLYKEVPPGKHVITSRSENVDSIELDTQPGRLYYIRQEILLGYIKAKTQLNRVSEEEGKKGVLESRLAETK